MFPFIESLCDAISFRLSALSCVIDVLDDRLKPRRRLVCTCCVALSFRLMGERLCAGRKRAASALLLPNEKCMFPFVGYQRIPLLLALLSPLI